ncbi:hypothetical protein [Flavobacterium sp. GT3R68]|uniref:OB-fold protein n=1 Tax=Flavobacterium sp. GT3R68 TaxID=2594437 RepID=UPI000F89D371|nr:hypothetical protein [Flavobacterium sp. GT3R68]RTY87273.1 hypothetical protein EKL32_26745 [Flavobacterium sp. GSN2]TRW89423.1 hypothetical protein FNW07_13040 [Flavobacterium sp. GT3R68]
MQKNTLFIIAIFFIITCIGLYFYIYKSHRDINSEKESFKVSATSIYTEFIKNETKSNQKYLDKTIEVSGKISGSDPSANVIILDDKLVAVFKDKFPNDLKTLTAVKIKGRFIGYDELLDELKMDQCAIVNP